MREVDLSIVTFRPDLPLLRRLFASLAEPTAGPLARNLLIQDNSGDAQIAEAIASLAREASGDAFQRIDLQRSAANVGYGRAHNAAMARGRAPFALLLNQDCVLEPGVLDRLLECAEKSPGDVAVWELRQIPYEHPKAYDPATLETPWASGAAFLVRRAAFESIGGFDPRIFMYGEDVDLSWRLRARGWRIAYQPQCAVVHQAYRYAGEVKPLQLYEGTLTHLCLRARYAGWVRTLKGLAKLAREITRPSALPGRRWGLLRTGLRFLARWPSFGRSRVLATGNFEPRFLGWDYERHREGAFHEFRSLRDAHAPPAPLVSILIRTCGRPAWLRQALASCAHQTHPNIEVVVVESGPGCSRGVVEEFADRLAIRYQATGGPTLRAHNGNLSLALARGEWLNFLDDDDVLFADHVEVLLRAALDAGLPGAYGLAWEARTRVLDREAARFEELDLVTRHAQPFDRLRLWHENYLPIQSVIFHRRLYERHGGFDEGLDQLEDWNLWTRYTLEDDFVLVRKTTSKYRVPHDPREAAERQARLDAAYGPALERQRAMHARFSPQEVITIARAYARRHRLLARVAQRVPLAARMLRRTASID